VLILEGNAPGGQAGSSSHIENYLGFPSGITGQDLADRASYVSLSQFRLSRCDTDRRPRQLPAP
jgi:thioredoxin reductase (NADPH)